MDTADKHRMPLNARDLTDDTCIIDLFAGVGGLSLGAARAGFRIALAVERDQHALTAHKKNFPECKHLSQNIATLTAEKLMASAGLEKGQLSGLIGGPPCQGFSAIGHQRIADRRNSLFTKFFKLVLGCMPKFFVAENVMGILDQKFQGLREEAFEIISDHYTILEPIQIKASDYGAATSRERVFFIGHLPHELSLNANEFKERRVRNQITVSQALEGLPKKIRSGWILPDQGWRKVAKLPKTDFFEAIVNGIPSGIGDLDAIQKYRDEKLVSGCLGTRHSSEVALRYKQLKPGEQDKISKSVRLRSDGLCPTLRAGTGPEKGSFQAVRPIHPTAPRVITPREAARLQGFPDWFQFSPSKWHSFRQIGNSVSPFVAEAILRVIREKL